MTVATSSGHVQHEATLSFGQVNLLAERIAAHENNYRRSRGAVRGLVVLLLIAGLALPYGWVVCRSLDTDVTKEGRTLSQSKSRLNKMGAAAATLAPTIGYLDRKQVSGEHLLSWKSAISILESAAGTDGLVSQIKLKLSPGQMDAEMTGETRSLLAANELAARYQDSPATKELHVVSIKEATTLDATKGAAQYEIKGKIGLQ